jgi:large subunit ribosomal protein L31
MKEGIHPKNYRLVAFKDMSNEHVVITRSAAATKETIEVDGVEYPLFKLEISSSSHPFYTGKMKLVDTWKTAKYQIQIMQKKRCHGSAFPVCSKAGLCLMYPNTSLLGR